MTEISRPDSAPAVATTDEVADLRRRLDEAEETLEAIRSGAVDAFVVDGVDGPRVYTLQSADRPYRALIESMRQGALVLGPDGVILYANPCFAELVGVPRALLAGSALETYVAVEDRPALAALITRCRDAGWQEELRLVRDDRTAVPAHICMNLLQLDTTATLCAIVSDLTQQKHFEALRLAQEELTEADRNKDEFLAMLAHELRNPLVPLQNGLHILELAPGDGSSVQRAREMMGRQLKHIVRLVDELLDISRITMGKLELRRERTSVNAVLQAAEEAGRPLIEAAGHALAVSPAEEPLWVDVDVMRLSQVLVNLLDNAAKYTRAGGKVELLAAREYGQAVIRVRDTGAGIPPDQLPRLFDKFFQAGRPRSSPRGGLGIGLSVSRRLVQLHGGAIEARSSGVGEGSEFIVRLPLATTAPRPGGPPGGGERRPEASRRAPAPTDDRLTRVLVADDNVDAARSLAMVLEMAGYEVRVAHSGREALEQAEWFRPTVLLLDLSMPELDGFEVCRRIRAQPWGEEMRLLALSGWGQPSHRSAATEAGFDRHLVKPIEPAGLIQLVRSLALGAPSR
jgi:PAS domain S-box-containing protein